MTAPLPQLSTLTFVGIQLNAAVEIELRGNLSFLEVYRAIQQGTLLREIDRVAPGAYDFSAYPQDSEQCAALHEALRQAASGVEGLERRKLGLISSGIHLVLALILEAIKQCYWLAPRVNLQNAPSA